MSPWPYPLWPEFWPWAVWRRHGAPLPQPPAAKLLAARYHRETRRWGVPPWAWLRLLALGPLPPSPPVVLTRSVAPVFDRYVFAGVLSNFDGVARGRAWEKGYRTILVQLGDGSATAALNTTELLNAGAAYRAEGWRLAGWNACQDGQPEANAQRAALEVYTHGLDGWMSNWEAWGEGLNKALATRWTVEWRRAGCPVPLGLSCLSSETPNYARDFDYAPWVALNAAICAQVYGDYYPAYTVANMKATMKRGGVPPELLAPTFGAVGPYDAYADYTTWLFSRGIWVAGQVRQWV
jgi:hypothetical protein